MHCTVRLLIHVFCFTSFFNHLEGTGQESHNASEKSYTQTWCKGMLLPSLLCVYFNVVPILATYNMLSDIKCKIYLKACLYLKVYIYYSVLNVNSEISQ